MAFTGKALYDSGVFDPEVAEDITPTVSMISPFETPLLDRIGDSDVIAESIIHEYMEASLQPNSVTVNATIDDSATTLVVTPALIAGQLMKGTVLDVEETDEKVLVTVTNESNGDLTITRGFGGTTAATIATTNSVSVLFNAALEGSDVDDDISVPRVRKANILHIFKKDVIISGSMQAVSLVGGITSELDYQIQARTREILRDLERAVIRSSSSSVTLGSGTAYRTMKGIWDTLATNQLSYTDGSLTSVDVNTWIRTAWENGAKDIDLLVVGKDTKDEIDALLETQRRIIQGTNSRGVERIVDTFESSYGVVEIMLNRWMKPKAAIVTATRRLKVPPLRGRTFQFRKVADTGDSTKGYVVGEYTLEVHNEEGMVRALGS